MTRPGQMNLHNVDDTIVFRYIVERGHRSNTTICDKPSGKHHVYSSNGREVQIHIDANEMLDHSDFIVEYQGEPSETV